MNRYFRRLIPDPLAGWGREALSVVHSLRTDLHSLSGFLAFVGNSRSGTTLVRTLLDTHPAVVLGNEVHALKHIHEGRSWHGVTGRILANSDAFALNPVWTGYSYQLDRAPQTQRVPIRIIGDKKAAFSADMLAEQPELLARFRLWSPVPIYFLQCIRNPLDTIATLSLRHGIPVTDAIALYFRRHQVSADVRNTLGAAHFHQLYLEDLIASPESVLEQALHFLRLETPPDYLAACCALVKESPNTTRHQIEWPTGLTAYVNLRVGQDPYLSRYHIEP